jgi:hypothetical protein
MGSSSVDPLFEEKKPSTSQWKLPVFQPSQGMPDDFSRVQYRFSEPVYLESVQIYSKLIKTPDLISFARNMPLGYNIRG